MDSGALGAGAPDVGMLVLKGGGALLLVLALLLLSLYLLRRLSGVRGSGSRMRTLEVLPLGAREKVVLVAVRDRELLLGVTAASIRTLAEFPAETPGEERGAFPASMGFGNLLAGILKEKGRKAEAENGG